MSYNNQFKYEPEPKKSKRQFNINIGAILVGVLVTILLISLGYLGFQKYKSDQEIKEEQREIKEKIEKEDYVVAKDIDLTLVPTERDIEIILKNYLNIDNYDTMEYFKNKHGEDVTKEFYTNLDENGIKVKAIKKGIEQVEVLYNYDNLNVDNYKILAKVHVEGLDTKTYEMIYKQAKLDNIRGIN